MRIKWTSLILFVLCSACVQDPVAARDSGQWENSSPEVRAWFKSLMMPDHPSAPCCGEADGYWCDKINVEGENAYCTVDDDRDDAVLHRSHIDNGTRVRIPPEKFGYYPGNPTGHAIVFMSVVSPLGGPTVPGQVYCFVQGGGT